MNVAGVPESVPWETVKAFLQSLGLDLSLMPKHHGGVVIANNHIRATVYALDPNGQRYVDRIAPELQPVMHEVCIPIVKDKHEQP